MTAPAIARPEPGLDRTGLIIGTGVGLPVAVAVGALMALARAFFDTTNAALVLMLVVVAIAALGGRTAGIVTALGAVVAFDFFHTEPYLSLVIDSRDDIETTVLLLAVGILVGTIATRGRSASHREGVARSEIRRIHRVAETAAQGRPAAEVIAAAQDELRELLSLTESRFEALPFGAPEQLPRLGRNGAIERQRHLTFGVHQDGRTGFELPAGGVELPVLARGQQVGRFVLVPTPGVAVTLEERLVAVAIADQVAAVWVPETNEKGAQ